MDRQPFDINRMLQVLAQKLGVEPLNTSCQIILDDLIRASSPSTKLISFELRNVNLINKFRQYKNTFGLTKFIY